MDALSFLEKSSKAAKQPVYALIGDETFLVRRCREAIIARHCGDADPEYAVMVVEGPQADFAAIRNELDTLPFLAPVRIVIVEDADKSTRGGSKDSDDKSFLSKSRESLEKYVGKPSKAGVLVLEVKSFPETTKLAKALPDAAKIACKAPKPESLPKWCSGWARSAQGKILGSDAASMLYERIGPQMGLLATEIDKLSTAIGEKTEIAPADVDRLVQCSREANVFAILDAIGHGQPGQALSTLHELFEAGDHPLAVLGAMTYQLRRLASFERFLAVGMNAAQAMDAAGVAKWPAAREAFDKQVRHLGRRRLQQISDWLVDVNQGLKGGCPLPPEMQVERLVVKLAAPRS